MAAEERAYCPCERLRLCCLVQTKFVTACMERLPGAKETAQEVAEETDGNEQTGEPTEGEDRELHNIEIIGTKEENGQTREEKDEEEPREEPDGEKEVGEEEGGGGGEESSDKISTTEDMEEGNDIPDDQDGGSSPLPKYSDQEQNEPSVGKESFAQTQQQRVDANGAEETEDTPSPGVPLLVDEEKHNADTEATLGDKESVNRRTEPANSEEGSDKGEWSPGDEKLEEEEEEEEEEERTTNAGQHLETGEGGKGSLPAPTKAEVAEKLNGQPSTIQARSSENSE